MNKLFLSLISLLLISSVTSAQQEIKLFYNSDWEVTNEKKYSFYRICHYDLNEMKLDGNVKDFDNNGSVILKGVYSRGKKNGYFQFFYSNGNKRAEGSFENNSEVGEWTYFYENAKLKQKILYTPDGELDMKIHEFYDRNGDQLIANGTGIWIQDSTKGGMFDFQSLKKVTGKYQNYEKHGKWEMVRLSDGKTMVSEKFRKNKFISGEVYNSQMNYTGTVKKELIPKKPFIDRKKFINTEKFKFDDSVYSPTLASQDVATIFKTVTGIEYEIKNRLAGYKYGDFSLLEFISKNLTYPREARIEGITGKVYVSVTISTSGEAKETKVFKGSNSEVLDTEALRVVKLVNDWLPALQDGEAIESQIVIPVSFTL